MDSKEVLLFITFLQLISLEEGFGNMKQDFYTCDRIRNVTIVPFIKEDDNYGKIIAQMAYLIKSLLDTPCTTVWVYSPLEYRSIAQNEDNFNNFLETEIQAFRWEFDNNIPIVNLLKEFKELDDEENEQTLFFINDIVFTISQQESLQITDYLIAMASSYYISVVMWCTSQYGLCSFRENTISKHKIIS